MKTILKITPQKVHTSVRTTQNSEKGDEQCVQKNSRGTWRVDNSQILNDIEIRKLRANNRKNKEIAEKRRNTTAIRDHFVCELVLHTGLRVFEIWQLNCGDVFIEGNEHCIRVRNGKGGKFRIVHFDDNGFKKEVKEYLNWKKKTGESIKPEAPLISSTWGDKTRMSKRSIQEIFYRCLKKAGIQRSHSIHHGRHTFATKALSRGGNIRIVQSLLGHESVRTTEIYTHLISKEIARTVRNLYT